MGEEISEEVVEDPCEAIVEECVFARKLQLKDGKELVRGLARRRQLGFSMAAPRAWLGSSSFMDMAAPWWTRGSSSCEVGEEDMAARRRWWQLRSYPWQLLAVNEGEET